MKHLFYGPMPEQLVPAELLSRTKELFPSSPLALIGCRAQGYAHPVCEYDFIVLSEKREGKERLLESKAYIDLHFVSTTNLDGLRISDMALTLYRAHLVSDPSWTLTTLLSKIKSLGVTKLIQPIFIRRIRSALSKLTALHTALDEGSALDAAYWLQSAAYDCSDAVAILNGHPPSPSHTFGQMQNFCTKNFDGRFKTWSDVLNVDLASTASVRRRLDLLQAALERLAEARNESSVGQSSSLLASPYYFQLAEKKALYLVKSHNVVEAYCYVGRELIEALKELFHRFYSKKSSQEAWRLPSLALKKLKRGPNLELNLETDLLRRCSESLKRLIRELSRSL